MCVYQVGPVDLLGAVVIREALQMHKLQTALSAVLSKASILSHTIYLRMRKGRWQVIISCVIGVVGIIVSFIEKHHGGEAALLTFGSYFAFLIGIAAVTILVNSITIGLLVYYFQSVKAGQNYYYDRFRDAAAVLRDYLDSLHENGLISSRYDEPYRDIELLTMKELPVAGNEVFILSLEQLSNELRNDLGPEDDYERIAGNVEVKAVLLSEAVNGLWLNLIQRIAMRSWISPVVKSFWTLALTILAVIIGAIYFAGVGAHILTGLAIGIGCMTVLLILEIGFIAVAESKEFFDDERDVDHSQTEAHIQVPQEETPRAEA